MSSQSRGVSCSSEERSLARLSRRQTGSSVSRNGCTVDLKQICKTFFDQPTFNLNGVQYDSQLLQSEPPRHTDAALPYNYPNGDQRATHR
jgi:hypothetical protein